MISCNQFAIICVNHDSLSYTSNVVRRAGKNSRTECLPLWRAAAVLMLKVGGQFVCVLNFADLCDFAAAKLRRSCVTSKMVIQAIIR
jgi:hypothetical protein